jgi:hypothetical protein
MIRAQRKTQHSLLLSSLTHDPGVQDVVALRIRLGREPAQNLGLNDNNQMLDIKSLTAQRGCSSNSPMTLP